ncbi:hypothetical protein BSKO_06024 [Bryopsis sp. KO-2023]|nr:hypothetical protein BSKO_06024 [Bryopsis sp. KO-2023]
MFRAPSFTGLSDRQGAASHLGVASVNRAASEARMQRQPHQGHRGARSKSVSPPRAHPGNQHVHATVVSPHPDAVRRRREAEERRMQRSAALEATMASVNGSSGNEGDLPNNLSYVDVASELDFRLKMGSRRDKLVVAHFKASWCSACARMQYKVKQIAEQNPDVTFLIIDVGKNPDLLEASSELGVEKLPFFLFYKNEECVAKFSCNLSKISLLRAEVAGQKETNEKSKRGTANVEKRHIVGHA